MSEPLEEFHLHRLLVAVDGSDNARTAVRAAPAGKTSPAPAGGATPPAQLPPRVHSGPPPSAPVQV